MGEKLVVGPTNQGLRNDRTAFIIDNDSFPTLINAYQWRGRVKRKRGTSLLGRLQRYFDSTSTVYNSGTTTITLVAGAGNLLTGFVTLTGSLIPGSITITTSTPHTYTDNSLGVLIGSGGGTINYATGAFVITTGAALTVTAQFQYYPSLPVMGLEDLMLPANNFPGEIAFDQTYAYNISTSNPYPITDVSFYKNPPSSGDYVAKTLPTPVNWNGLDYQQFYTVNYQGALFASNGVTVPFTTTNIGMQFKPIVAVTIVATGPAAKASLNIVAHGLVVGDFVFINEVVTTTGINLQTGFVITFTDDDNVIVEFPTAVIANNGTGGIAQYLTNTAIPGKDCIRYYDGSPTTGVIPPVYTTGLGWVNFMPPLSQSPYSIADLPPAIYYLVGCKLMYAFKDRLIFFGAVVQSSSSPAFYLEDTAVYSQNGTTYYECSFVGDPRFPTAGTLNTSYIVPVNQTAFPAAYFEDSPGFGGFQSAAVSQPITTAAPNEDALIVGFMSSLQTRFVYTGNDLQPFNFYIINAELGSGSTFSSVTMDEGVISKGPRGFITTSQTSCQRIDLPIPDQVFQIQNINNGPERVCSQRDFINEWIYFTYAANNSSTANFPNQSLQFNYRDNSWAIFNESYTTYGTFRKQTGQTWATLPADLTWATWDSPWNSGASTLLQPLVIAGNQQGFVMIRDTETTNEGTSLYIQAFAGNVITVPNHNLASDENGNGASTYIVISGAIGTIGASVNGNIFSVLVNDANTLTLNPSFPAGTYFGGGLITRMYNPFIQTKQFPYAWQYARKVRLACQQYLFSKTPNGQITLLIYLSQDADTPYNDISQEPNDSIIYSTLLYTCPESTNLGLTPANTNLQTPTASRQQQLWHRMNTSLIGDTVQIGFTMNDDQMRDITFSNQFEEIELHAFILDMSPSQLLV